MSDASEENMVSNVCQYFLILLAKFSIVVIKQSVTTTEYYRAPAFRFYFKERYQARGSIFDR